MRKLKYGIAGVIAGILGIVGVRNFLNSDSYSCDKTPIKVEPGDDYWGYLEKYCEGNLEAARGDVVEFYGTELMPGRVIYLPTSDECELKMTTFSNGNQYVYESCPNE
ncbi:MAG: hypothetical protein EBW15_05830 [Actinobacteria bacterium]|jgi:hypothetical protein|nr:hypothetical protein [Actinomycetota bacterium]